MTTRPNILWISFEDTLPYYGCYGDPVARTPHVDRLAAEGCRFPNAFSTAGVCAPARSAIITGMYPISIGTHHMRTGHVQAQTPELPTPYQAVPPSFVKCFPEYLRAAGYYCTNNVKTDYQFQAPLTAWDECSEVAHWRNRPDPQQPFFAVFNPTVTHESGMWDKGQPCDFDPAEVEVPPYFPDTPKVRAAIARMHHNIALADTRMGELLAQLEEDGLAENTIIMHWSDHGPMPRGKRWLYDQGIRVPLIIRAPGTYEAGTVSERLISTIDLGPTVLSLTGVDIPAHLQGEAFMGEQETAPREFVFAGRDRFDTAYDKVRATRDKRFKYIRNDYPELPYLLWIPYRNRHPITEELWRCHLEGSLQGVENTLFQPRPVEELYDTLNDRWEVTNLAKDPAYAPELERLREATEDWLAEVGDLGEVDESEMVRRWRPDGKTPQAAPVVFASYSVEAYGPEAHLGGEEPLKLTAPAAMALHSPTQGGSIAYQTSETASVHWQLYTTPLKLSPGKHLIRAKTIRIGYENSVERTCLVEVMD